MSKGAGFSLGTVLGLALLLVFSPGCGRPGTPNVLLVTIDTLRADHVGCYGRALARTPNLDRLAQEGVRVENAAAVAPITLPSHCSIMTGLYPPAHGVRDNGAYSLGEGAVTLAERLKAAGYATQAFVSAIVLARRYNLKQGFDGYDDDLWAEDQPKLFLIRNRRGTKTATRFLEWLDRWKGLKPRKPFFAWVHLFDPHAPYEPLAADLMLAPTPYDGEIAGADRAVGMLLDGLRQNHLLDDTIVVVTADHGESLGEHGEKTHAIFVYDATIHVPLILRYPRLLPRGKTYGGPVSSVDIVPTLLSALRLPGGGETQGLDLLGAFAGRRPPPEHPQYIESLLSEVGFGMAPLAGIRSNGYKFIRAPRPELYNLKADPRELTNLYASDPRRAAMLDQELERVLSASKRLSVEPADNPMSRESIENLISLGYLTPRRDRESMGGIDPKDGIAVYNKLEDARHFAQRQKWEQSQRLLREILGTLPGHVSARNVLALTLVRQGRFEEAAKEYRRSLEYDAKQSRVLAVLGSLELQAGRLDEAAVLLKAALEITPGFVEAICNLGFVQALRGDETGARAWYAKAVATDPSFPRTHTLIADLYFERGDWKQALAEYENALRTVADDFLALIQAGNCTRRIGDPAGAERFYRKAEKLRPDSWIPVFNLACLEAIGGRRPEAVALLREAVGRGLDNEEILARDADLQSLRPLPEFRALLKKIRAAD
jgi:choline-sulfatase